MSNKIIDRIQKLLRLANNAGSEAEAATAAKRAADMMAEYEIQEAQLSLATEAPRVAEPIENRFQVTSTKKKVAWHMRIANSVAESYGARAYWTGGRVNLFGRLSAVQAASYTTQYLIREVEKITDREAPTTSYSKAYRNAFRLGCAVRVGNRIEAETAAKNPKPVPNVFDDLFPADAATDTMAEPVNPMALAIVEKDHKEVEDAYDEFSSHFGSAPRVGKVSSGGGYQAGKAAGGRVNLGGNARGGLKGGQGSFK